MCTVIYIPQTNGALFASCRDENPRRLPALHPKIFTGKNTQMLYPADGLAGGTWVGVNNAKQVLILLNGGFENHIRNDYYRKSRGLIMAELLDRFSALEVWKDMSLENIEPFTLISYHNNVLHQLVWTGDQKTVIPIDSSLPFIWSSATLYNNDIRLLRRKWLHSFISNDLNPTPERLLHFLKDEAPKDEMNGFVMNRNEMIKTCSISLIETDNKHAVFSYEDLQSGISSKHELQYLPAKATSSIPAGIVEEIPSD